MTRLRILVEGQAEEMFVKRTLHPFLRECGVEVEPIILLTKENPSGANFLGGVSNWKGILTNLLLLTGGSNGWVTTLIDYYGLPADCPGYRETEAIADPEQRVVAVQTAVQQAIDRPRLIPFFALHEFEAWLFSDPQVVADHFGQPDLAQQMGQIVQDAGAPERINHGPDTHPKARLRTLWPYYRPLAHGPLLMGKIGISRIRAACPHFDKWLTQLENLPATPVSPVDPG
ncbi:MAG: DUF4276 family protein [Magnetococcus sp. YQC-3]